MVAVTSSSTAQEEPESYDDVSTNHNVKQCPIGQIIEIFVCKFVLKEPDESVAERLWGLTEMFPESVRTACEVVTDFSINSTKTLYKFSCNASWIFFTSSMILFAPVLFETERAQMAELEMSQKQRVSFIAIGNSMSIPFHS